MSTFLLCCVHPCPPLSFPGALVVWIPGLENAHELAATPALLVPSTVTMRRTLSFSTPFSCLNLPSRLPFSLSRICSTLSLHAPSRQMPRLAGLTPCSHTSVAPSVSLFSYEEALFPFFWKSLFFHSRTAACYQYESSYRKPQARTGRCARTIVCPSPYFPRKSHCYRKISAKTWCGFLLFLFLLSRRTAPSHGHAGESVLTVPNYRFLYQRSRIPTFPPLPPCLTRVGPSFWPPDYVVFLAPYFFFQGESFA